MGQKRSNRRARYRTDWYLNEENKSSFKDFISKVLIVIITGLMGSLVLNVENQYLRLDQRILYLVTGNPKKKLSLLENHENNTLLLTNSNNSIAFIYKVDFIVEAVNNQSIIDKYGYDYLVKLLDEMNNTEILPNTGSSFTYQMEFDYYDTKRKLKSATEEERVTLTFSPSKSIDDPAYIEEINPREPRNLSFKVLSSIENDENFEFYLTGHFNITYFIHDKQDTIKSKNFTFKL